MVRCKYYKNIVGPRADRGLSDDKLFSSVLTNSHHVLKQLLPDETSHQYNLRSRRHNLSLSVKTDDRNFIIRQLFRDSY